MRRWCRLLLMLVGVVVGGAVLAGCQADVALHIDVNEDGSGVVTASIVLDPEAASHTVLFESPPVVDDLEATGWEVVGPTQQADSNYLITASKGFSRADQLHGLIEELAGPNGAFRDFRLDRSTSFAKRNWTLTGTVDLTKGLAGFSDDELNAQLGGPPLGPDKASEDAALGRTLESIIHVSVTARLPGTLQDHNGTGPTPPPRGAPTTTTTTSAPPTSAGATTVGPPTSTSTPSAEPVTWQPSFADPAPLHLEARSSSSQLAPRLWRWLAAAAAVVGGAVLVYQLSFAGVERMREHRRAKRRRVRSLPTLSQPEPELEGLGAVMAPGDVPDDLASAGVGPPSPAQPAPSAAARPMAPPPGDAPRRSPRSRAPSGGAGPPPDAVRRDTVPRDPLPRDTPPSEAVPSEAVPSEAVPSEAVPSEAVPSDAVPREVPSEAAPSDTASRDRAASEATLPSETARSEVAPPPFSRPRPSPAAPPNVAPAAAAEVAPPAAEPPDGAPPRVVPPAVAAEALDGRRAEPAGNELPVEAAGARPPRATGSVRRSSSGGGRSSVRLLVIETAGVLFSASDPVQELLVPHVRARGSELSPAVVNESYVSRVVGGLPPVEFWIGLGILGDPMLLDDSYARRYELSPDIDEFLRQAVSRGMDVVTVGEEAPEWVGVFRQRFALDQLISAWVTSSDVGVRPPHPALVQAALRATGQPADATMVIARNLRLLDGARRLGCRTVHYLPEDTAALGDHPLLRSFAPASS